MYLKTRLMVMLLAAGLCLTIASCGDSKDTPTTSAGASTNSETFSATDRQSSPPITLAFDQPAANTNPLSDPTGPFYHTIYKTTSADGLNFTVSPGAQFEHASVPDIIRMPRGRLFIYAVDGANRSRSGLMVAMSDDDGATWQQGSLQSGGSRMGADPEAVVLPDGSIRLYYVVFPKDLPLGSQGGRPALNGQTIRIQSAISRDGVNFEQEPGVRYESSEFITDPDVVEIGGRWFMYVSKGPRDVAVTSADGMTFTLEKTIREKGSVSNTVPISPGTFRQFYCNEGIRSATSSDGLNWQDDPGTRVPASPDRTQCDPAPVQLDAGWLMVYKDGPLPRTP